MHYKNSGLYILTKLWPMHYQNSGQFTLDFEAIIKILVDALPNFWPMHYQNSGRRKQSIVYTVLEK